MFLAKNNNQIIYVADTLEKLNWVLVNNLMTYTDIEYTEETYVKYGNEYMTEEQAQAKEEEKERERKAKLRMTKRDFFLYVVQPFGVTYLTLMQALSANDTIKACYEGCNHIYRYDAMLVGNIKTMLEAMTGQTIDEQVLNAQLDAIFEEHNATD